MKIERGATSNTPFPRLSKANNPYPQITKLFGINYDTPSGSEPIHASMSQQTISQPGSYMLAPSYSEALLMDPAPDHRDLQSQDAITEMVPSYSEALLYQRADQGYAANEEASLDSEDSTRRYDLASRECSCPCHAALESRILEEASRKDDDAGHPPADTNVQINPPSCTFVSQMEGAGKCGSCGRFLVEARLENESSGAEVGTSSTEAPRRARRGVHSGVMPRDMSEPNLRTRAEPVEVDTRFLRLNGQSLGNILENEQEEELHGDVRVRETPGARGMYRFSMSSLEEASSRAGGLVDVSRGAIPKRMPGRSRVIANPMSSETCVLPNSKTYFCLKSILKQNNRRYTLITARELQNMSNREDEEQGGRCKTRSSYHEGCTPGYASTSSGGRFSNLFSRSRESLDAVLGRRKKQLLENLLTDKGEEAPGCSKHENR